MTRRVLFAALLFTCLIFASVVAEAQAQGRVLQELILQGLRENLGLQVNHLDLAIARDGTALEKGTFDVELFAAAETGDQRTPNSSILIPQDSFESQSLSAEVGVRKHFRTGLDASLSFSSLKYEDSSVVESLNPKYQSSLSLELRQPLLRDAGAEANLLSLKLAEGRSSQAAYSFLQKAQNLTLGIEIGYLDLLNARAEESLRKEALELTRVLYRANKRKLEAGQVPISEVQQADTALAGRDLDYLTALQRREIEEQRLARLLNTALPEELSDLKNPQQRVELMTEPAQMQLPGPEDALVAARESRPDVQIAKIEIAQAGLEKSAARRQRLPQLDLSLQLQANGLSGAEKSPGTIPYAGSWSSSLESLAEQDGYQWGAGLHFSYPLGNRSPAAAYRVARRQVSRARLGLRDLEQAVETEIRERLIQTRRLSEMVVSARRFQSLAEVSLQQENRRLEEGLSDTFRVLDFQERMISAKINHFATLVEFNKSLASLSYAMGSNLMRHGIIADLKSEEIRFEEY